LDQKTLKPGLFTFTASDQAKKNNHCTYSHHRCHDLNPRGNLVAMNLAPKTIESTENAFKIKTENDCRPCLPAYLPGIFTERTLCYKKIQSIKHG
jgi:hypothetical protein